MLPDIEINDEIENGVLTEERNYYPNGKLKTVRRFKDGIRHGVFEAYATDGQLYRTSEFENGILINFDGLYLDWNGRK